MRPRADRERSGSELGCPTSGVSAIIDDQRLSRLHASVGKEARIVRWPCLEGVDQVSPIKMAEAVPHPHSFKRPGQFQRARPGGGVQRVPLTMQEMDGFGCAG